MRVKPLEKVQHVGIQVGPLERVVIPHPDAVINVKQGETEAMQDEVHEEATDSPVPIVERVNGRDQEVDPDRDHRGGKDPLLCHVLFKEIFQHELDTHLNRDIS